MIYLVVDRFRQHIDLKYLLEYVSTKGIRPTFNTFTAAKKYLIHGFFDDSDYAVFKTDDYKVFYRWLKGEWVKVK